MTLRERIVEASKGFPARFEEQSDGTLKLESKIAERKVFLSKKTLTYVARLRIDDESRTVKFFETLKETGLGLASGDSDISPGFGFKKETYKITGKGREGEIQELSKLFGREYRYLWDYSKLRKTVQSEAEKAGYAFSICLAERDI
ncbi:MAG: ribonucleoside-triphosphate reductase [Candidatus Bathyarchaeia archaeon]